MKRTDTGASAPSESQIVELLADVPPEKLPALLAEFRRIADEHKGVFLQETATNSVACSA
jgi:hypothetical protein